MTPFYTPLMGCKERWLIKNHLKHLTTRNQKKLKQEEAIKAHWCRPRQAHCGGETTKCDLFLIVSLPLAMFLEAPTVVANILALLLTSLTIQMVSSIAEN